MEHSLCNVQDVRVVIIAHCCFLSTSKRDRRSYHLTRFQVWYMNNDTPISQSRADISTTSSQQHC